MEYKEKEYSLEAGEIKGRPYPQWFLDEPATYPGDEIYLKGFYELDTCRPVGMAIGQIPWSDIYRYAVEYLELDSDVSELFIQVIRQMDAEYLKRLKSLEDQKRISQTVANKTRRK